MGAALGSECLTDALPPPLSACAEDDDLTAEEVDARERSEASSLRRRVATLEMELALAQLQITTEQAAREEAMHELHAMTVQVDGLHDALAAATAAAVKTRHEKAEAEAMAAAARRSAAALVDDEITPRTASERALEASLAACAANEEAELTGRMDAVETAAAATAQGEEDNKATIAALHARTGELNAQVEARQQDRATIAALEKRCVELEDQVAAHAKGEGEVHASEQNNENVVNRALQRFIVERI